MEDPETIPVWCAGQDWCPITATAKLIGKKWHPVIIHRLIVNGALGFNDLKEEVDGISSKVLSESLDDLQEKNLVEREIVSEKPVRVRYTLTEKGESLESVVKEMKKWGDQNLSVPDVEEEGL
ncbi:MAG: winged helix-turn-helix transcriptional regulator [Candidatus Nanohaloarchaea archaeon]